MSRWQHTTNIFFLNFTAVLTFFSFQDSALLPCLPYTKYPITSSALSVALTWSLEDAKQGYTQVVKQHKKR